MILLRVFFFFTPMTHTHTDTTMIQSTTRTLGTAIIPYKRKGIVGSRSGVGVTGQFEGVSLGMFWQNGDSPSCRNTELYFKVVKWTPPTVSMDSSCTQCWRCCKMSVLLDLLVPTIRPERISHLVWVEWQTGLLKKKKSGVMSHLHLLFR